MDRRGRRSLQNFVFHRRDWRPRQSRKQRHTAFHPRAATAARFFIVRGLAFTSSSGRRGDRDSGGRSPRIQTAVVHKGADVQCTPLPLKKFNLLFFLYLLPILFISAILLHSHKQGKQSAPIKGDERIEIGSPTVHGLVADKQKNNYHRSNAKPHKVE